MTRKTRNILSAKDRDFIVSEYKAGRVPLDLRWSPVTMARLLVVALDELKKENDGGND